jgi:hypothetical protein
MRKAIFVVLLAVFSLGFVVSPALAGTCPKKIAEVKDAMAKGKYDKAKMDGATKILGEAESLHKADKHADALKKVEEARKLLGLKPGEGG